MGRVVTIGTHGLRNGQGGPDSGVRHVQNRRLQGQNRPERNVVRIRLRWWPHVAYSAALTVTGRKPPEQPHTPFLSHLRAKLRGVSGLGERGAEAA